MKKIHPRIRKALCLMLALVMVLGMFPALHAQAAEDMTLYLVPNSNWKNDNARFAIYYWNAAGTNAWASMSDTDGDGVYEGVIPAGYPNIIFCRMSPTATANNWNNKWNQTADLTVPTDGTNCYTVKAGTWDNGGGTWSTYAPEGEEPSEPIESEPIETEPAPEGAYYVAGVSALCGSEWNAADAANQLVWNGTTGLFEKVYENVQPGTYQFKITDGTWNNAWGKDGQNYTFEVTAVCDVTITFDAATKLSKMRPRNTDEAQYNIAYPVAAALIYGDFGLAQVREENLGDPKVVEMMKRLSFVVDEELDKQFPARRICRAELVTKDGRKFLSDECEPRGEAHENIQVSWLQDKFRRITGPIRTAEGQEKVLEMITSEADMPIRALVDEVNKAEYWK